MMTIRFSLREHKNSTYTPQIVFSKSAASILRMSSNNASIGDGYFFAVCSRAWLHGKYLRFRWRGDSSWAYHLTIEIWDGEYSRSSATDFPNGSSMAVKGNGKLQTVITYSGPAGSWYETDRVVNVSGGTQDNCTIFFKLSDNWYMQWLWLELDWFEINTSPAGVGNLYSETFSDAITMEKSGGIDDYGYISSGDLPLTQNLARSLSSGFSVRQDIRNLGAVFAIRHSASGSVSSCFVVRLRYDLSLSEGLAFYWWGSGHTASDTLIDLIIRTPTGSLVTTFTDGPAEWRWVEIPWSEFKEVGIDGSRPDKTRIIGILWTYHTIGLRRVDRISSFRRGLVHGAFTVRQGSLVNLGAGFSARRSAAEDLRGGFFRGKLGIGEMRGDFIVLHTATKELPGGFYALQASSDLGASFSVGQGAEDLKAKMLVVENFLLWTEVDGP